MAGTENGGAPVRSAVFVSPRYGAVALGLHWLIAALIAIAWVIPHVMDFFSGHDAPLILELHRSIGVTILVLVLLRLIWRTVRPLPPLPRMPWLLRLISHAGHVALYLLMLAVPVLGMVFTWATGRDIALWGLVTLPAPFQPDDNLAETCRDWHALAANAMLILAGLHTAAALFHQYVLKDGLLDRMLPLRRRS